MAPPAAASRSTNSHGIPPTTRRPAKLNFEIGPTSPAVAMPPGKPNDSASVTFAPLRAAAIAATNPAGPAPATNTSACNVRRDESRTGMRGAPAEPNPASAYARTDTTHAARLARDTLNQVFLMALV